jgi:hypothetical protein
MIGRSRSEMTRRSGSALPPSPIRYTEEPALSRVRRYERVDHCYDAAGYRIFEAARLSDATVQAVWGSVQRFPDIWSRLGTTGGAHHVSRLGDATRDIAPGNVIVADAIVFGIRVGMQNVVTTVVEGRMFHLSVRALGGRFESEVEASVESFPGGALLIWRQAYPDARLLSRLTCRLLRSREAEETKRILDSWVAEQE